MLAGTWGYWGAELSQSLWKVSSLGELPAVCLAAQGSFPRLSDADRGCKADILRWDPFPANPGGSSHLLMPCCLDWTERGEQKDLSVLFACRVSLLLLKLVMAASGALWPLWLWDKRFYSVSPRAGFPPFTGRCVSHLGRPVWAGLTQLVSMAAPHSQPLMHICFSCFAALCWEPRASVGSTAHSFHVTQSITGNTHCSFAQLEGGGAAGQTGPWPTWAVSCCTANPRLPWTPAKAQTLPQASSFLFF